MHGRSRMSPNCRRGKTTALTGASAGKPLSQVGKPENARSARGRLVSAGYHEIDGFRPLALLIGLDVKGDPLPFVEGFQSRTFHGGDVHEHIASTVIRFDKSVSAFAIEEFDRSGHCHRENSYPVVARH